MNAAELLVVKYCRPAVENAITERRSGIPLTVCLWFVVALALMPVSAVGQDPDLGLAAAEQGDYARALQVWAPLAEQGDVVAQYNLAVLYSHGRGVPQDYAEAVRWYRMAAEQGHAAAQYNLAFLYHEGRGVPQDYAEAVGWYRMAAEQGEASAQYNLALLYSHGRGVPQDYVSAHMWFNIAAASGLDRAARGREILSSEMTTTDVSEAHRRARVCLQSAYQDCD